MREVITTRTILFLLAGFIAVTFSRSGVAQGPGVMERGLDPFDALRGNGNTSCGQKRTPPTLWILLDVTDSMKQRVGGGSRRRLDVALDSLQYIVRNAKPSGGPGVNWAFWVFCGCDTVPQVRVPLGNDNAQAVLDELANGERTCTGTQIGRALNLLSDTIAATPLPAGQKHTVLLVTDGIEGCNNSERNINNGVGRPIQYSRTDPRVTRAAKKDKDELLTIRGGEYARQAIAKIDPAGDGSKADVFTVGVDLDSEQKELTNHIAWSASNDRRAAFFANNEDELLSSLRLVFDQIKDSQPQLPDDMTVSLTNPVVGTVKELIPYEVQTARGTNGSNRNVTIQDVMDPTQGPILRAQNSNNVLLTTSTELPSFKTRLVARKVFNVLASGQRAPAFGEVFWDAGEELQKRTPDGRTIFFSRGAGPRQGELIPFRASTNPSMGVTPEDLGVGQRFLDEFDGDAGTGALTALDAAKMVVGVTRGYQLSIHPETKTFYKPNNELNFSDRDPMNPALGTWKLWDATHAGPSVVISPARSIDDAPQDSPLPGSGQYADFYNKYVNRLTMAYLGTNYGMMHAFRADNGFEQFAYIPDDFIGPGPGETVGNRRTLAHLVRQLIGKTNGLDNHFYGIASSAVADDVFLRSNYGGDDDWHTAIFFGRGEGGKFLTGLDVTQVGDWTGTLDATPFPETGPRVPRLLFNVGNRDGVDPFDGMGETWSTPAIGQVRLSDARYPDGIPQWVLFAGSGYGSKGTLEGRYFYVLRVEDGSILKSYGPIVSDPAAPIPANALVAPPAPFNPHLYDRYRSDEDDYVTRVFIGDLYGNVYKLDSSTMDPGTWSFGVFYSLASNPQAGANQPITAPAGLLYRGMGQGPSVCLGTGGDKRIVKSGSDAFVMACFNDDAANGTPAPGQPIPLLNGGSFILPLAPGERIYVGPVTAFSDQTGGSVFFVASTPGDPCTSIPFTSSLYGFVAASGLGAFDSGTDGNVSRIDLGAGKATGLYARGQQLYVGRGGSVNVDPTTRIFGDMPSAPSDSGMGPGGFGLLVERFGVSDF